MVDWHSSQGNNATEVTWVKHLIYEFSLLENIGFTYFLLSKKPMKGKMSCGIDVSYTLRIFENVGL